MNTLYISDKGWKCNAYEEVFCVCDAFHDIAWQGWRQLHAYETSVIINHKIYNFLDCDW